jgi:hypothetical protein
MGAGPRGGTTKPTTGLPLLPVPRRRTSLSEALRGAIEDARQSEMVVRQRVRLGRGPSAYGCSSARSGGLGGGVW